ncbi:MAG: beta-ketoacyl synthase N-terminal-like domain-containing protein, partial [Desulfovibrionaceae bacterium]|nr:beta-ketoacyl synthase N-terminal-like domain-containing protein [Desulfovibrionaceae bacterium]
MDERQDPGLRAGRHARNKELAMEETVKNEWHGAPGVAVIGMAGRFPGARDIRQFWKNLVEGADNLTVFTDEELKDHVPADLLAGPGYVKAGYILDNVDEFDAAFFGYTPHEAETTDPQQRLFLECCWEAFEDAGHIPGENPSCGVFASISPSAYLPFDTSAFPGNPGGFFEVLLGNDKDYAASRVAYKMNLNGPAFSVQSACSSSLVGICQACQSLLDYHCDLALAGGASISLPERAGYMTSDEGGLSRDGRCHAFDHRASGMNYGNGVAVVLLKRVEDAVADGDHIYGVIRGFAVNNDGSDKVGFVAPSVRGQKLVIEEALDAAEVDPGSITCVETHGTGTPLGDPIELAALSQAYGEGLPCALTSVKTNIGHLNAAAGAAGLIRLMLSLDRGQITPLLNYEAPNPEIDFAKSRFYPSTETRPWTASPKRAGISSFGLGGTNAHLVVEEAPADPGAAAACAWHLVPLSAKSPEALEARRLQLEQAVQDDPDMDMARLAWTLQRGRAPMPHRLCL